MKFGGKFIALKTFLNQRVGGSVFPTRVGMNRDQPNPRFASWSVPHASGDEPDIRSTWVIV